MTATMHFDGTRHVVIASEAKQSFTHKNRYLLKVVCEKTYKKKKFSYCNTITQHSRNKKSSITKNAKFYTKSTKKTL
ncbi:MAG: hypothetical protein L3J18_05460 [Candidatus Brocadia sp.]|nr:MAG: hypothetical protein L3J18_05460 [Candidatus Brocadia sp.]